MTKTGELAALATALCWTITALCFEFAAKRVGTLALNLIRLVIALLMLSLFSWVTLGTPVPLDAGSSAWIWLSLSGLTGFVLGDLFLFRAFIEIGARTSMLIYASVPPMVALLGWSLLGELPTLTGVAGMALTVAGIAVVVLRRTSTAEGGTRLAHPVRGVLFALAGSLGQAVGLVLSKVGAPTYNAFSATQIRVIAGVVGFVVVILAARAFPQVVKGLRDRPALGAMSVGALFGPFIGVSLGLVAVQNTTAGIASTIMATTPVLIIVPSVLLARERVTLREIGGALTAVVGVALLFLT